MYNTDISITGFKNINSKVLNELTQEFYTKFTDIPVEFNWAKLVQSDTYEITFKKSLISDVKNQYLCGCCWAVAVVTAISDAFVISDLVSWRPEISYTYALSKYPQSQCKGGSSRILLEEIAQGEGIASDYCVDHSWCTNDSKCVTRDSSLHFKADAEYLNKLIPSEGCYDGDKRHYIYYIDDVYSMTVSEDMKVFEAQSKMKQHIMVRGPLVTGFLILENFPKGDFVYTNNGIYFEKCDYSKSELKFDYDVQNNILGSHSVVIVGWGIAKNVNYKNTITNIPYWYCRNSWGENWGENGYFKIAMYPYNKVCQFSKQVRVLKDGEIKHVGGTTGFKVSKQPVLRKLPTNNYNFLKQKSLDENVIISGLPIDSIDEFNGVVMAIGVIILMILFVK